MCTRILWNSNKLAVLAGRTMDWPESTEPKLTVFPRGRERHGGMVGDQVVVAENALEWTSKHGSVVVSIYGLGAIDGVNEVGFALHGLFLMETDVGARDPRVPGLQMGLYGQYLLDQAANVAEALALIESFQPVEVSAQGHKSTVHFALEDASGDSAIIEYVEGKPVVHHGREFTLMTNSPTYDEQLRLLGERDFSHPDMNMELPGNVNPRDRFQRAAYYLSLLPEPENEREAAAGVFAIARNVSVPFGAPYRDFGIYDTEYRTVVDLTNRVYFFELTTNPNVIWTELDELDFAPGAPVLTLDPHDISLSGDVSHRYAPDPAVAF